MTVERKRLPDLRPAVTHKRTACGVEFYVTVGFYDTDRDVVAPAEVFVIVAGANETMAGMVGGLCVTISLALQYGVPWDKIRQKYLKTRFGPPTDPDHSSILDGIAKGVDACIEERRRITGFGEDPESQKIVIEPFTPQFAKALDAARIRTAEKHAKEGGAGNH